MKRVRAWWHTVTNPPRDRPDYFVMYLIMMVFPGLMTFLQSPATVEAVIGPWLSVLWSVLLLIGGFIGGATVLSTWWAMERAAIMFIFAGLALYLIATVGAQVMLGGARWGTIGLILICISVFHKRAKKIRQWSWAPPSTDL